jgi:DNA topoisomerase-1
MMMLRYVEDQGPGITRKRRGRYWMYFGPDGERIADREEIDRLNAIGMPPAYERCWFCPDPNGHMQAVGYDAKGRKQYRYHPEFRAEQESVKYERLAAFGRALPKLRKRVETDMDGRSMRRDTVLAAVVRLIDTTHMRVGSEEYAQANKSFGATTLRNRHAKVKGNKLVISYAGKHGVKRSITIHDRRLIRIARRTQELPGQHLFEFVNEDGGVCPVTSTDVNAYIKEAMGDDFSAKDFRTWGASVIAFEEIVRRVETASRIRLKNVIEPVAEALGNTPAISRKSYVHPALIEALKDSGAIGGRKLPRKTAHLSAYERGLIEFLEALPKEEKKLDDAAEAVARTERKSRAAAKAEVVAAAKARLEAEAV